jgi:hypothetical protein
MQIADTIAVQPSPGRAGTELTGDLPAQPEPAAEETDANDGRYGTE